MIRGKFVTLKHCPGAIRAAPKGENSALKQIRDKVNEKFKDYIADWNNDTHWPMVKEHLPALAKESSRHVWVRLVNKIASLCGGKSPPTQPIKNRIQRAEEIIMNAGQKKAAVRDEPWFTEPMFEYLCQRIERKKVKPGAKQLQQGAGSTTAAAAHSGGVSKPISTTRAPRPANPRSPTKKKGTRAAQSKQPPLADNMERRNSPSTRHQLAINSPSEMASRLALLERALSLDTPRTGLQGSIMHFNSIDEHQMTFSGNERHMAAYISLQTSESLVNLHFADVFYRLMLAILSQS
eukprot:jgi/Tetstr1/462224/TSEL_000623.t1